MTDYSNLEKLHELKERGVLSDAEYQVEKQKLLEGRGASASSSDLLWGMRDSQYAMFMHLSQFTNFVVPFAGTVLPIVMWAVNKERSVLVDRTGRRIINWMISEFIYTIISAILIFVIIGIPMLLALLICSLVFTIMGATKANSGAVYRYPMSIPFIRVV